MPRDNSLSSRRLLGMISGVLILTSPVLSQVAEPPRTQPVSSFPDIANQTAPDLILAFAEHLFARQDYYRAITEYERFVFLFPNEPRTPVVKLRIAESYFKGGKLGAAAQCLTVLSSNQTDTAVADKASRLLAETTYQAGRYTAAISLLDGYLRNHPGESSDSPVRLRLCLSYLQFGNVEWAKYELRLIDKAEPDKIEAVERFSSLPAKSPVLAGVLSAVLPGAGQMYGGKPKDAAISFTLNGLAIVGAVLAFDREEPVAGTIMSVVGLSFYSGNIYNAANNAHQYNRVKRESFIHELEIKWGLLSTVCPDGHVPVVGLSMRF